MDDFLYFNIERFLSRKRSRISGQKRSALILRWLTLPSMSESLRIIDRKVGYLLEAGGEGKLNQWLLSNDIDFTTITAERYIIDYLKSRNSNIEDNLRRAGIDALLNFENQRVGIEITTLNSFIAEWIFMERLTEFLSERRCMDNKTLRITFSSRRIVREFGNDSLYGYLETVGNCILSNDIDCYSGLEILLETEHRWSGYISWELKDKDSFPWLKCLTGDLLNKIAATGKTRQLNKNTKNLRAEAINCQNEIKFCTTIIPKAYEGAAEAYEAIDSKSSREKAAQCRDLAAKYQEALGSGKVNAILPLY